MLYFVYVLSTVPVGAMIVRKKRFTLPLVRAIVSAEIRSLMLTPERTARS